MTTQITSQQYGQAILEHVENGSYPETEEIISGDLPPSALPEISELIEQAKEDVKSHIRKSSKTSAPDVDGWIAQAKQLSLDIQKSQEIAREVVNQAQQCEHLEAQVNDAASKVNLLNDEIAFNESLGAILEQLRSIQRMLDLVQRATLDENLLEAVTLLKQVDENSAILAVTRSSRVFRVLEAKITDLRTHIKGKVTESWNHRIVVDPAKACIQVRQETEGPSSDLSAQTVFHDMTLLIQFLRTEFPPSIYDPLARLLIPRLVSRLVSTWLASAVPENLDFMQEFGGTLSLVKQFGDTLENYRWPGKRELTKWRDSIPDIWLRKRKELSLDRVRTLLSQGLGTTKIVERTETQVLSPNDEVFASNSVGEDWNAGWSDEQTSPTAAKHFPHATEAVQSEDEEDVSAWGLDEKQPTATQGTPSSAGNEVEETDAWGWGDEDEDEDEETKTPQKANSIPNTTKVNGKSLPAQAAEREVTLTETYTITSLPKEILVIINQVISDAIRLETSDLASLPISQVASELLSLPGLILAMYRASSAISYSRHQSGQMFLYNDSIFLSSQLHNLDVEQTTASGRKVPSRTAYNLKLVGHISAIESFGKRAYAKEMESQRTIITDLLDGAQGFLHCTEHPFTGEADLAVASTVDRLRGLYKEWSKVLSHSALLQSLGSLLSTVINKIIIVIEDMSDISEPESQQLTTYCNRIATLEDLFRPVQSSEPDDKRSEHEIMPMTALYTSHWLKFQYLVNILESSLVDIKYLWTEGELGLEFDTEELVDLVVALFADSPHRRTAIAEIRGRRGVR
ncbi:ribosome biogenesis protein ytm1 [Lecanora helva]